MTVEGIDGEFAECAWFVGTKNEFKSFKLTSLEIGLGPRSSAPFGCANLSTGYAS